MLAILLNTSINSLWHHTATKNWVNHGSGNGQHQAITWTNVELSSVRSSDIHLKAISKELPLSSITEISFKIYKFSFKSPRGQWVKCVIADLWGMGTGVDAENPTVSISVVVCCGVIHPMIPEAERTSLSSRGLLAYIALLLVVQH